MSVGEIKLSGRPMIDCGPILIVDQDSGFRASVSRLFARAGFETREATGAEEALSAVRAQLPSLVLLDVALGDASGFEVCRELRDEFGDELPIVFVSGDRVDALDRSVGLLLGGDDYMVKPLNPDELLARARRLISRSAPKRAPLPPAPSQYGLTERELEVLQRLAEGLRPKEIAREFVVSPKTVASHIQHVLAKLGVHSRVEAVALAYREGLVGDVAAHMLVPAVRDRRAMLPQEGEPPAPPLTAASRS